MGGPARADSPAAAFTAERMSPGPEAGPPQTLSWHLQQPNQPRSDARHMWGHPRTRPPTSVRPLPQTHVAINSRNLWEVRMQQHIISEPEIAMPGRPCATSHVPGDPSARPHSMAAVVGVLQWSLAPRGPQGQLGDFVMADRPPQSDQSPQASLPLALGLVLPAASVRRSWPRGRHSTVLFPLMYFTPHAHSRWPLLSPCPCGGLSSGSPGSKATP